MRLTLILFICLQLLSIPTLGTTITTDFQPITLADKTNCYIPLSPILVDGQGQKIANPELIDAGNNILVSGRLKLTAEPTKLLHFFAVTSETQLQKVSPTRFQMTLFKNSIPLWQRPENGGSTETIPLQFMLEKPETTGAVQLQLGISIFWKETIPPQELSIKVELESFINSITSEVNLGGFNTESLKQAITTARAKGSIQFKGDKNLLKNGIPPSILDILLQEIRESIFKTTGLSQNSTTKDTTIGLIFAEEKITKSKRIILNLMEEKTITKQRVVTFPISITIPETLIIKEATITSPTNQVAIVTPPKKDNSLEIAATNQRILALRQEIKAIKKQMAKSTDKEKKTSLRNYYNELKKQTIDAKKKLRLLERGE
jgi:hypothetical protein